MNPRASFSPCGAYRYRLSRPIGMRLLGELVGGRRGTAVVIMLNPSTADASLDDPTIRRCRSFADEWNRAELVVGNLYAYRATQPEALWQVRDPVGPDNDAFLATILAEATGPVLCAWGVHAREERVTRFRALAELHRRELVCLGTTKGGAPRHPLYVRGGTNPRPWPVAA